MIVLRGNIRARNHTRFLASDVFKSSLMDGIIAYYNIDETSGNILYDANGGSINGTIYAGNRITDGIINSGWFANNTNGGVRFGSNFALGSVRTYNIWIRNSYGFVINRIFAMGNSGEYWQLHMSPTQIIFYAETPAAYLVPKRTLTAVADLSASTYGGWHMITLVYTGSGNTSADLGVYFNGVYKPWTDVIESPLVNHINYTTTFGLALATSQLTNSEFDEFGLWDRVLTNSEIESLYRLGDGNQYPFGPAPAAEQIDDLILDDLYDGALAVPIQIRNLTLTDLYI